ncbi:hypothetical protein EPN27_03230 [Patescibacteria group bacterium]|nr:MAG: hypothetical protein EPN27_03230 [Patescibacteria group bacterium]
MQQEQIKKIIINGLAVLVIVGVVVTGYMSFTGGNTNDIATYDASVVGQVAEETRLIGDEIDRTVSELRGLDSALESSVAIFDLPAFMNLEDFSISIFEEPVGRDNPFIPTLWKEQMKVIEGVEQKSGASSGFISSTQVVQPTPASNTWPQSSSGPVPEINPGI